MSCTVALTELDSGNLDCQAYPVVDLDFFKGWIGSKSSLERRAEVLFGSHLSKSGHFGASQPNRHLMRFSWPVTLAFAIDLRSS
jgi:hypothetical protein